jgi:hypothetical protein
LIQVKVYTFKFALERVRESDGRKKMVSLESLQFSGALLGEEAHLAEPCPSAHWRSC